MKHRSKILTISGILVVAIACAAAGYYMYNKGPVNVKNSKATEISASELYEKYISDSIAAGKIYDESIVQVKGEVSKVSTNSQQQQVILLKTGADGAFINCTLEEATSGIKIADNISVKGICSGIGQGDPDLGIMADVYLTRSYVSK